jgi:Flp pilus assembly protein TadG
MKIIFKFKNLYLQLSDFFNNKKGQSSLEFILVLPLLILAILIISQSGYIIYTRNLLENAAEQAARAVAVTNSNNLASEYIRQNCSLAGQDKLSIDISPQNPSSRHVGDYVTVTVSYNVKNILSLYMLLPGMHEPLKGSCTVRMESEGD